MRSGLAAWFDARQAEGWVAEYADLSVQGFPNRFDTSLTDVAVEQSSDWNVCRPESKCTPMRMAIADAQAARSTAALAQPIATPFARYASISVWR